jgi:hypothetical protein
MTQVKKAIYQGLFNEQHLFLTEDSIKIFFPLKLQQNLFKGHEYTLELTKKIDQFSFQSWKILKAEDIQQYLKNKKQEQIINNLLVKRKIDISFLKIMSKYYGVSIFDSIQERLKNKTLFLQKFFEFSEANDFLKRRESLFVKKIKTQKSIFHIVSDKNKKLSTLKEENKHKQLHLLKPGYYIDKPNLV